MFSSLSIKGKFISVLLFFSLGFALVSIFSWGGTFLGNVELSLFRKLNSAVTLGLVLAGALGSAKMINKIWSKCKFLNTWVMPNINGVYEIETSSNWPLQKMMLDSLEGLNLDKTAEKFSKLSNIGELNIKQSFFHTSIFYKPMKVSESTTLYSDVVSCSLTQSSCSQIWNLFYLFNAKTTQPKRTDVPEYQGAAKLDINVENGEVTVLVGHYWTNRSWQKAINTAGEIKLIKKQGS